ncbi:MAG: hypothetical protein M0007_14215, partial [Actinomycetota bacterium]|nr:hypothetical protein [Actinomycetota bacterium]
MTIHASASVTAADGGHGASAVGVGLSGSLFGSLANAGTLTVPAGSELIVPSGATATNTGTVVDQGSITGAGTIANEGTIVDLGTVTTEGSGPAGTHLLVQDDNYTLDFTTTGLPGTPSPPPALHVFAPTLAASDQALPSLPPGDAWAFGTTVVTGTTDLPSLVGRAGPATVTLHVVHSAAGTAPRFHTPAQTTFAGGVAGSFHVGVTGSPSPTLTLE